ncbi:hypothetical protein [Agrococcus sp. SGAir0287]|uniref:hypothetical protein n=1 Tax=Agrococcus sp. SGAir0287 TaxID=2070347 RepID=UPI0010CD13B7|nr:hypothetical protein [Agrococcus sp. SGAir0287]QCR19615.1 hypothetical protein C1N71_09435 [Agrococcus sp. SGAir0287]
MNLSRIAGAAALGAAAILTLAGCIQLPSPQAPTTTTPTTTEPGTTTPTTSEPVETPSNALVDTQWSGTATGPESSIDVTFTFQEDGTLYITAWSGQDDTPYDDPTDTWSLDGDTLELTLSNIQEIQRIDLTGTYTGSSPIQMTGTDGVGGTGYTMTLTQG